MKTAVYAVTRQGAVLACKVARSLDADLYLSQEYIDAQETNLAGIRLVEAVQSHRQCINHLWSAYEGIILIMACGIAVRGVSPLVVSKTSDPAVVVADELGRHIISLLSGHLGGANSLAAKTASITGGEAVITTATDINGVVSFDLIAKNNNCYIENIEQIKHISSALLEGETVMLKSELQVRGKLPEKILLSNDDSQLSSNADACCSVMVSSRLDEQVPGKHVLILRPSSLVLGVGCRRGTSYQRLKEAFTEFMALNKCSPHSIAVVASADLKSDEEGILHLGEELGAKMKFYPGKQLEEVKESCNCSDFVKKITGAGSVSEGAALLASDGGRLICGKTVFKGITFALAEKKGELIF